MFANLFISVTFYGKLLSALLWLTIFLWFFQSRDERNYHIFYQMLVGMSPTEKAKLKLTHARDYYYLTRGNCLKCDGIDDKESFAVVRGAMKVIEVNALKYISLKQF